MAQMDIYIDEQLADRLDKAVRASGKSKSKWVREIIERELRDHWPEDFFDLAGSWQDDEGPDEIMKRIRSGMGRPDGSLNRLDIP